MPGGGTAHGPQPRQYTKNVCQDASQALKVALSDKARAEKLVIIDDFKIDSYKTKAVQGIRESLFNNSKVLFIDRCKDDLCIDQVVIFMGQSLSIS